MGLAGKNVELAFIVLHCFQFIFMGWFPYDVIKNQAKDTQNKRDDTEVFECIVAPKRFAVKVKEFADHPVAVGCNPNGYGQVMAQFAHVLPGAP